MIGLFGAVSIVLGILETFIPLPVPAVRLGLANLGVMMMFYAGGVAPAASVMILKMLLVPLLTGNLLFRLSLSVPSSTMAFIGMALCFIFLRKYTSPVTMGVVGAFLHMITQLFMINLLYIKGIYYTALLSAFLFAAIATGILTGVITILAMRRIIPLYTKGVSNG